MINMKKALLAAAIVALAPVTPMLMGSSADASANTYVSGSVSFGSPVAVVGYSYGNPYLYGPVCDDPYYCDYGPVYYYPSYHCYAPRYSSFSYFYYPRPHYFYRGHGYGGYGGGYYGHGGYYGRGGYYGGGHYGRHYDYHGGNSRGHYRGRSIRGHGGY